MKNINTISFDLWGTLIKSNPQYSIERNILIKKYSNNKKLTDEIITNTFKQVKEDYNFIIEKYGAHFASSDIYHIILDLLQIPNSLHYNIMDDLDELFIKNPPTLYDENTLHTIIKLYTSNIKLKLISNTLLIRGEILLKALPFIELYFKDITFSDQIMYSKPHYYIFNNSYSINKDMVINKEILHVGDNIITDIKGARDYGVSTLHINGNSTNDITEVLNLLNLLEIH